MANPKVKSQEKDQVIIEEDIGVFQRTIEQSSPSKRKRDEEIPDESPKKYTHTSHGNRSATTTIAPVKHDSLSVPFWKHLNGKSSSNQFQTTEIGSFSLLTRAEEKECFEDKRYLRGKYSSIFFKTDLKFLFSVYKYPLETLNVNFDLKIGESDFISEGSSKNIDAMLWWILNHKQEIFKNNQ